MKSSKFFDFKMIGMLLQLTLASVYAFDHESWTCSLDAFPPFKQLAAEVRADCIAHRRLTDSNSDSGLFSLDMLPDFPESAPQELTSTTNTKYEPPKTGSEREQKAKRNWTRLRNNLDKFIDKAKAAKVFTSKTLFSKFVKVARRTIKRIMDLDEWLDKIKEDKVAGTVGGKVCPERTNDKEKKLMWMAIEEGSPRMFGSAKKVYDWFSQKLPDLKQNVQLVPAECTKASKLLEQVSALTGYVKTCLNFKTTYEIADRMAYWILGEEIYNGKGCLGKCSGDCKGVAPVKLENKLVCNECYKSWIPPSPKCSNKERNRDTRRCKECDGEWNNSLFDELRDTPNDIRTAWNALRSKPDTCTDDTNSDAPKVVEVTDEDTADPPTGKSTGIIDTLCNWWKSVPNISG